MSNRHFLLASCCESLQTGLRVQVELSRSDNAGVNIYGMCEDGVLGLCKWKINCNCQRHYCQSMNNALLMMIFYVEDVNDHLCQW